jgi:hypothetical protein
LGGALVVFCFGSVFKGLRAGVCFVVLLNCYVGCGDFLGVAYVLAY